MRQVNVAELRSHLSKYLSSAQKGTEILITYHGQVIARIVPPVNARQEAQSKLKEARKHCKIGDVISPIDDEWDANK